MLIRSVNTFYFLFFKNKNIKKSKNLSCIFKTKKKNVLFLFVYLFTLVWIRVVLFYKENFALKDKNKKCIHHHQVFNIFKKHVKNIEFITIL